MLPLGIWSTFLKCISPRLKKTNVWLEKKKKEINGSRDLVFLKAGENPTGRHANLRITQRNFRKVHENADIQSSWRDVN